MIAPAHKPKPEGVRHFPVTTGKGRSSTVPAAWPTGMTQFMQAYEVCGRCPVSEVCEEWRERALNSNKIPPAFCPNVAGFISVNKQERRGWRSISKIMSST